MRGNALKGLLAALIALLPGALPAQDPSPPMTPGWESLPLQAEVLGNALGKTTRDGRTPDPRRAAPSGEQGLAPAGSAAVETGYRASPEVSARVRRQFVAWIRGMDAREGDLIEQEFRTRDYVQVWAEIVRSDGFRTGDVVDALASYWIVNWIIANGRESDAGSAPAVRGQVREVLIHDAAFARLAEAQRQEMAEVLMLNFVVQFAAFSDAYRRQDEALKARLGEAARARFRNELGLDLLALDFGADGLVERR